MHFLRHLIKTTSRDAQATPFILYAHENILIYNNKNCNTWALDKESPDRETHNKFFSFAYFYSRVVRLGEKNEKKKVKRKFTS